MKEEWKVYIKGVPNRGEEVIKMLKDLGAKNSFNYDGNRWVYLYYIWHDGSIHVELIDNEYGQIIIDNYHEIKLPEQWKDGDILFSEADNEFAVFDEHLNSNKFFSYLSTCYAGYLTHQDIPKKDFRLATESEIEQFYNRLHAINKDWDTEKKQLVDWEWKPKKGEDYWTVIVGIANKLKFTWFGTKADEARYKLGNCFKTREEAEVMAEKVKNLFLQNYEKTKENS